MANSEDNTVGKPEMELNNGRLSVDNQQWAKPLTPLSAEHLAMLTAKQVEDIIDTDLQKGENLVVEGNTFIPYAMAVDDMSEIRKAYVKMKLCHPGAQHIVCAYCIPGLKKFECEEYCDDGDHNVGRNLLKWMQHNNLDCRVFFVARYQGRKLSAQRFESYREAALNALNKKPENNILGIKQNATLEYQTETSQPNKSGGRRPTVNQKGVRGGKSQSQHREDLRHTLLQRGTMHKARRKSGYRSNPNNSRRNLSDTEWPEIMSNGRQSLR